MDDCGVGESWLRKSRKAGKNNDLDAQFVFLWIAFNALYGRPRYRDLKMRVGLAPELLSRVKAASPQFFERLVVELLLKMGYGGLGETRAKRSAGPVTRASTAAGWRN
jgi:hypothetical protein